MKSFIDFINGRPYINVDGEALAPLAYTTYFDECAEYADFAEKGYKMYFVNVSFNLLPINNVSGFSPFTSGVFEGDTPDFSGLDENIFRVLSACPDALIFPRIHISMPERWTRENEYETVETPAGGRRESMFSDLFRKDGAEYLKILVAHIRNASYADRIAGYQLCGGTTQEWFHHDLCGSFSTLSNEKFARRYGENNLKKEDFFSGKLTPAVQEYARFSCEVVAKTAEYFAKVLKEFIDGEQIVGIFYGYDFFVNDFLWGHQGLRHIIKSPYIDFFSSPCAYDNLRSLSVDWGDMIPVDAIKQSGKLCFIECDIRTYLTKAIHQSRPGKYPDDKYTLYDKDGKPTIWKGPDTEDLSISALRKTFCHQMIKASGVWWFDMWGGWYHSEAMMSELFRMREIAESAINKNCAEFPCAEVAVFLDEKALTNFPRGHHLNGAPAATRCNMSCTGIPFDLCMVEDAPDIVNKYRAAIFTAAVPSEEGRNALELFRQKGIFCLEISEEKTHYTPEELRSLLIDAGVHCYNTDREIIYAGGGFVGIHSVCDGEKTIELPEVFNVRMVLGESYYETDGKTIKIKMKKYETALFELERV